MGRHIRSDVATVAAAKTGDPQAVEQLVADYLPLTYHLVDRAVSSRAEVDDIVARTMVEVVRRLPELRDPGRFRPWLVAIAITQMRARTGRRTPAGGVTGAKRPIADGEAVEPGADDPAISRLGLSGQRREVTKASRWLDADERELLSLWWLETTGNLTRGELAAAMRVSVAHATVRVQRLKSRLDDARALVRALGTAPCPELRVLMNRWDSRPSGAYRRRLFRHARQCPVCRHHGAGLVSSERVLGALPLPPIPPVPTDGPLTERPRRRFRAADARAGKRPGAAPVVTRHGAGTSVSTVVSRAAENWLLRASWARSTLYVAAIAVATLGVHLTLADRSTSSPARHDSVAPATSPDARPPAHSGSFGSRGIRADPPAMRTVRAPSRYGSTIDASEAAPPAFIAPRPLPVRPERQPVELLTDDGDALARGRSQLVGPQTPRVTLRGEGYFSVRWNGSADDCAADLVMPSWTRLDGRLFHVASGGGRRTDDPALPFADPGRPWSSPLLLGAHRLPAGAQQMWDIEYYYLDGQVTLHHNGGCLRHFLTVGATTRLRVDDELAVPPGRATGTVRYGYLRDRTGRDDAPVPQYLTRRDIDPRGVGQRSDVRQ